MARTTQEHKKALDAVDAMITFSYLYEWQRLRSKEFDKLLELLGLINQQIDKIQNGDFFLEESYKQSIRVEVLDRLYFAIKNGQELEKLPLEDVWIGKHDISKTTENELIALHQNHFNAYLGLVKYIFNELTNSLPGEVKPYLTVSQVQAILEARYVNVKNDFPVPIHKELLASMIHQFFLLAIQKADSNQVPLELDRLTFAYFHKAVNYLRALISNNIVFDIATKLISDAKKISLPMDEYYSWSFICFSPLDYKELLSSYAYANRLQLLIDARYVNERRECPPLWRKFVINKVVRDGSKYRPFSYKLNRIDDFIFDSKQNAIAIDEKQLQNYAVLAIRYDREIVDLDDKLFSYAHHLGNLTDEYNEQRFRVFKAKKKFKNGASAYLGWSNYKRHAITDVGSILKSLCSLIILQLLRSGEYTKSDNKLLCGKANDLIAEHGFKYSEATVNTVRKCAIENANKVANGVLKSL